MHSQVSTLLVFLIGGAIMATTTLVVQAQQSFNNTSAAQPSTGVALFRQTLEYTRYRDDPSPADRRIVELKLDTQLAIGLTRDLAMIARIPTYYKDVSSDHPDVDGDEFDIGDPHIMFKYRFWQHDTGPIDTQRLSLLMGLDIPVGRAPFGNQGWDPMIGLVYTSIQGRHGVNAAIRYKFNTNERDGLTTGPDDSLADTVFLDTAYLYRLAPATYSADTHAAWYAMAEVNATYETNGDTEVTFAPGIMYEARNWVFEAMFKLPIAAEVDHRPEIDYSFGVGLRILF